MATYYWVGGNGTWDSATTTNWSLTSGGAGGAGFPTSADDVVFNSASNATSYTFTVSTGAVCKSLTMAGPASGSLTWTGTAALSIYGSLLTTSVGVGISYTGTITFASTATGNTINLGGLALLGNINFDGVGGEWSLTNNFTCTYVSGPRLINGTLNNGVYNMTVGSFVANITGVRTWNMGSGTTTLTSSGTGILTLSSNTNLTFNAGTSTLVFTNTAAGMSSTSTRSFYNIVSGPDASLLFSSCNNLTLNSGTTLPRYTINGAVNGVLDFNGSSTVSNRRIITGTFSAATVANAQNLDFYKCTFSGAAAPLTGTNFGDAANNSGITFPTAKTCYLTTATSFVPSTTGWATTSGGTTATIPLAQDTLIIDNNSSSSSLTQSSSSSVITYVGNVNASARTTPFTITLPVIFDVFIRFTRDVTLSSAVTIQSASVHPNGAPANSCFFVNSTLSSTFTPNGATINCNFYIAKTVSLGSAFTGGNTSLPYQLYLSSSGVLNTNNYNITCGSITGVTGTIFNFGSSLIEIRGSNASIINLAGTTINVTGSYVTVNCTYAGSTGTRTISARFTTSINITAGSDTVAFASGSFTYNLDFTGFTGIISFNPTTGATLGIYGYLYIPSGVASTVLSSGVTTFFATVSGVKTITTNGIAINTNITFSSSLGSWQLQDNLNIASGKNTTLTNGILDLNGKTLTTGTFSSSNSNTRTLAFGSTGEITLTTYSPTLWNTGTITGLTVTGSKVVNITDTTPTFTKGISTGALSEANAISFNIPGSGAVSLTQGTFHNLNFAGFTGSLTANAGTYNIYGSFTGSAGMTSTFTSTNFTFAGSSNATITCGNNTFAILNVQKTGSSSVTLLDKLYVATSLGHKSGVFTVSSYGLSTGSFDYVTSAAKTLNMGSGTWDVSSYWSAINYSGSIINCDTSTISMNSSDPATNFFRGGSYVYYNLIKNSATDLTIYDSNIFNTISNTVQPTGVYFESTLTNTFANFALSGTAGNLVTIGSTGGGQAILLKPDTWYMGANSVDNGGNTNLIFTAGGSIDYIAAQNILGKIANFVTVQDSSTVSETPNVSADFAPVNAETTSLTDDLSSVADYLRLISETFTPTDTPDATLTFTLYMDESAPITDFYIGGFQVNAILNESATLTDAESALSNFVGSYAETATFTEEQAGLAGFVGVNTDTVTMTDAQLGAWGTYATNAETATFSDTNTASSDFVGQNSESATFTDTPSSNVDFFGTATETVTLTDTNNAIIYFVGTCNELATFTEYLGTLSDYFVGYNETTTLTDSLIGGFLFTGAITESTTATDSQIGVVGFAVSVLDGMDIYALQDATLEFFANIEDLISAEDTLDAQTDYIGALAEIITLTTFAYYDGWFRINDNQTSNWVEINNYQG